MSTQASFYSSEIIQRGLRLALEILDNRSDKNRSEVADKEEGTEELIADLMTDALSAFKTRDKAYAIDILNQVLDLYPTHNEALLLRSFAFMKLMK